MLSYTLQKFVSLVKLKTKASLCVFEEVTRKITYSSFYSLEKKELLLSVDQMKKNALNLNLSFCTKAREFIHNAKKDVIVLVYPH